MTTAKRISVSAFVLVVVSVVLALIGGELDERPEDEIWFTKVSCPPGVPVPCLDDMVSVVEFERWLRDYVRSR